MSLKHTISELFSFSKKERIGFFVLLVAIIIVALLPFLKSQPVLLNNTPIDTAWMVAANSLQDKNNNRQPNSISNYQYENTGGDQYTPTDQHLNTMAIEGSMFSFDPNTLDIKGFQKLGLRDKTIQTLLNYRNKGGKFRKPDDLAKIYGLRQYEFERLRPYITIAIRQNENSYPDYSHTNSEKNQPIAIDDSKPKFKLKTIEINSADAMAYESLYGIGTKLAARIINFRDKLGGFHSIEQVGETFGVPDSTFQKIKPQLQVNALVIKKININTVGYEELNNHPYVNSKTAFQILKYRKEKGAFSKIDDIKSLIQPNDEFEKIAHYIIVE